MKGISRLRRIASFGMMVILALTLAACEQAHPNTTFTPHSDYGRAIDFLWDRLLLLGTIVFILVEGGILYIVFRYRKREGDQRPPQTHGNVVIEIIWTLIPAFILLFIAVPTVRTAFKTQAQAVAGALQIEVIGHQWWWEFRYPEYGIITANEIYIPTGRTVNFKLTSNDVIHSFWAPQLGGKRDAVTNRTNYIWLTPDSTLQPSEWNGFCAEYCGTSHAKMRFRVFTVKPDQFASWVANQQRPAAIGALPVAPAAASV
ncbi:MAG TPA: cytochrome c oxidase subunit II, partial [Gemmatimonadaceae bacterium]